MFGHCNAQKLQTTAVENSREREQAVTQPVLTFDELNKKQTQRKHDFFSPKEGSFASNALFYFIRTAHRCSTVWYVKGNGGCVGFVHATKGCKTAKVCV